MHGLQDGGVRDLLHPGLRARQVRGQVQHEHAGPARRPARPRTPAILLHSPQAGLLRLISACLFIYQGAGDRFSQHIYR